MHYPRLVIFLTLLAGCVSNLEAAEALRPQSLKAAPVIDGRLDDEMWQQAGSVTGFTTWQPDFGVVMKDQTIAYFAYDAENMYFAFRAFDSEPGKIKASMANRDSIRLDDWICINLDSFNDQQAMYAFYVNPVGVQMDSRFAANREDTGFDTVWYSAGRIDDQGYTVEVRIPFKSIRYHGGNPVSMGVIFERFVSRTREDAMWPAMDPKAGFNLIIQSTPIVFEGIRHYTLLEVLPDATYSRREVADGGRLTRLSGGADGGVTVKYGVTARLALDGTYSPDFSQVEADAGQIDINLRAPLFFAEKRPFFLEGQDLFNVGGPSQTGFLQSVLHTRTIVNPMAGVKLSGKVSRADTMAALYAPDEVAPATSGGRDYAHVSVLRYKHSLNQDSYLGGFYTGRDEGAAFNRVAGADGALRINQSDAFGFYAFGSTTRQAGGERAQAGHAVAADFMHDSRNLALYFSAEDISRSFQANSGYLTRNGVTSAGATVRPKFYPTRGAVRRVVIEATFVPTRDAFSGLWERNADAFVQLTFKRAISLSANGHISNEVFADRRFATSGVSVSASGQLTKEVRLSASFASADAIYYSSEPFGGHTQKATLGVVYQPSERWSETLTFTYADFDRADSSVRVYDYGIARSRTTFQANRYLFFRAIAEYNSFRRQLMTDLLASFTYIPGTVMHAGYGSLYDRVRWDGQSYVRDSRFTESRRGLFMKASYLWRL